MTTQLNLALQDAINEIDECVAAGFVDISTNQLLGVNTTDSHPASVLALVSAATGDLFAGANVSAIEEIFKKRRNDKSNRHYFQEIIVNSEHLIHVFIRSESNQNHVAVFVCRNRALMGMVLQKARLTMKTLEKLV